MEAVLTIIPGKETDLGGAVELGAEMTAAGRIVDCRPAVSGGGLSVILKDGTSGAERIAIANAFKALGYGCIEIP